MKKNPLVSIIIAVFNEEKNISACISSLLAQTYQEVEIILVNDGSTDKTLELAKKFPIKLISQKHQGLGLSRNNGSKLSKGEILVFLDGDMMFEKNFLQDLVNPIINSKFKGTFSKNEFISNWDNVWARCWNFNRGIFSARMIPENYPVEGSDFRAILKREFIKVGGFDDTGYNDSWTLPKKLGYKPHVVEGAKYFHQNPDNLVEVFLHAKWVSKREYKFGWLGKILALIKFSIPVSFLVAIFMALRFLEPRFLLFKIIYDLGAFWGILENLFLGKTAK